MKKKYKPEIPLKDAIAALHSEIVIEQNQLFSTCGVDFRAAIKKNPNQTMEKYRHRLYGTSNSEFGSKIGAHFGNCAELAVIEVLENAGYDCKRLHNSKGDMMWYGTHYEIKSGRGEYLQGSTHSPKEDSKMNLVQILWELNWHVPVGELQIAGRWIKAWNICVFENIELKRFGKPKKNSSRSLLKLPGREIKAAKHGCLYGTVDNLTKARRSPGKWVRFIKKDIGYKEVDKAICEQLLKNRAQSSKSPISLAI
jgi:hypothetical protein